MKIDYPITIADLTDALGITTYDAALPADWVDHWEAVTGERPRCIVWSYENCVFGEPRALTAEAAQTLHTYALRTGEQIPERPVVRFRVRDEQGIVHVSTSLRDADEIAEQHPQPAVVEPIVTEHAPL